MPLIDTETKSLLHFNGADSSTTFTDEIGKTWTAHGNAQLDTAQFMFGTASGLFDGAGDWIDTPDHADFDFGSGDFTIDFRIKVRNQPPSFHRMQLCGQAAASLTEFSFYLEFNAAGIICVHLMDSSNNKYFFVAPGSVLSTLVFQHIAFVRFGNNFYVYQNGNRIMAETQNITLKNSASKFAIGRAGENVPSIPSVLDPLINEYYLDAWIDEFRVSKGVARWTESSFVGNTPRQPYGIFEPRIMFTGEQ